MTDFWGQLSIPLSNTNSDEQLNFLRIRPNIVNMDTSHLEHTAEDLIAHKLQRAKLHIAKPKFDRGGADLIALLEVGDGAKFCRIQCKGRSLEKYPYSNVKVREEYVTGSFCLFLYIDTGDNTTHLFCFFPDEIKEHWERKTESKTQNIYYCLHINKKTFSKTDDPNNSVLSPKRR